MASNYLDLYVKGMGGGLGLRLHLSIVLLLKFSYYHSTHSYEWLFSLRKQAAQTTTGHSWYPVTYADYAVSLAYSSMQQQRWCLSEPTNYADYTEKTT